MISHYSKIHDHFKLNRKHYNSEALKKESHNFIESNLSFKKDIGTFLLDWLNDDAFITLKTSGSTGKPKTITMSKQKMINSAFATRDFFNLKPRNKALLCLPAHYIAGKMMLVRAMVIGLEIDCIEPKSKLDIAQAKTYDFAAMVPLQLEASYKNISNIKILIVGGATVSKDLTVKIQDIITTVFETYGMTETVSHIAVRQLNNFESVVSSSVERLYFKTLSKVSISQDNRDCLVVNAPQVSEEEIITNDIVRLHSNTTFEWLGRFDNVINSGGIKVFPEQIEQQLQSKIKSRFFIASEVDKKLGKRIILIIEAKKSTLDDTLFSELDSYLKPKAIYYLNAFVETASGKIQRKKTLQLLKK